MHGSGKGKNRQGPEAKGKGAGQQRPKSPDRISDWRCWVEDHWPAGGGDCPWDRDRIHLVYTDKGTRANFRWSTETHAWYRATNRSSVKKLDNAPPGLAAELQRLKDENSALRRRTSGQDRSRSQGRVPLRANPKAECYVRCRSSWVDANEPRGRASTGPRQPDHPPPGRRERQILDVPLRPGQQSIRDRAEQATRAHGTSDSIRASRRRQSAGDESDRDSSASEQINPSWRPSLQLRSRSETADERSQQRRSRSAAVHRRRNRSNSTSSSSGGYKPSPRRSSGAPSPRDSAAEEDDRTTPSREPSLQPLGEIVMSCQLLQQSFCHWGS